MRGRGDLTDLTGAGGDGAATTESVAACICSRMWRLDAIELCLHVWAGCDRLTIQPMRSQTNRYPARVLRRSTSDIRRSLTPNRLSSDQIEGRPRRIRRARRGPMVTMKTSTKAKARTNVRTFGKSDRSGLPRRQSERLIRPLRAALPEAPGLRDPSE